MKWAVKTGDLVDCQFVNSDMTNTNKPTRINSYRFHLFSYDKSYLSRCFSGNLFETFGVFILGSSFL